MTETLNEMVVIPFACSIVLIIPLTIYTNTYAISEIMQHTHRGARIYTSTSHYTYDIPNKQRILILLSMEFCGEHTESCYMQNMYDNNA